jgi:hypothetical protein
VFTAGVGLPPSIVSLGAANSPIPFLTAAGVNPARPLNGLANLPANQIASQPAGGGGQPLAQAANSAQALNGLLGRLQNVQGQAGNGGAVDPKLLSKLRFAPAFTGSRAELLQNLSNWPTGLSGQAFQTQQQALTDLTPKAISQALQGGVDAGTVKGIKTAVDDLNRQLALSATEMTPAQFIEAKRFLNNLEDLLKLLNQPVKAPSGRTVAELLKSMKDNGVQFAPAGQGDENAYQALQDLLSQYRDAGRSGNR